MSQQTDTQEGYISVEGHEAVSTEQSLPASSVQPSKPPPAAAAGELARSMSEDPEAAGGAIRRRSSAVVSRPEKRRAMVLAGVDEGESHSDSISHSQASDHSGRESESSTGELHRLVRHDRMQSMEGSHTDFGSST